MKEAKGTVGCDTLPVGVMKAAATTEPTKPRVHNSTAATSSLLDRAETRVVEGLPVDTSCRYRIFIALCEGFSERDKISRECKGWQNKDVVTVLGKEKKFG